MTLHDALKAGDPAGIERLYRTAQTEGHEPAFREALRDCAAAHPDRVLYRAWCLRLDVAPGDLAAEGGRYRGLLIGASALVGIGMALLARGGPPVPVPGEADPLFWMGWAPLLALGVLAFLARVETTAAARARYFAAAAGVAAVAVYVGFMFGGRTDDIAMLAALHLPFVCWAAVGAAVCLGRPDPARQAYAFLVKSVETVLTGALFFGAGMIFAGLTYGIFNVLGVSWPENELPVVVAWAVGAIPMLALGAVYDPAFPPAGQDWQTGLTRTLRILSRLLLPPALGVLLIYVLWFIPAYFWKPFEEREVLIVYNITILAVLVLMTLVISGPAGVMGERMRNAVLVLGGMTLILNLYALAAVGTRTITLGLTPNRLAVLGWNMATLAMLAGVGAWLWQTARRTSVTDWRDALGRFAPLSALWAVALLLALSLFSSAGA